MRNILQKLGVNNRRESAALARLQLSALEKEILALLAQGETHRAIGAALQLTAETVEMYQAHLEAKLGASNLRIAIAVALSQDLLARDEVLPELRPENPLTRQQSRVLRMTARGLGTECDADPGNVVTDLLRDQRLGEIRRALGVRTNRQAIDRGIELGLIEDDEVATSWSVAPAIHIHGRISPAEQRVLSIQGRVSTLPSGRTVEVRVSPEAGDYLRITAFERGTGTTMGMATFAMGDEGKTLFDLDLYTDEDRAFAEMTSALRIHLVGVELEQDRDQRVLHGDWESEEFRVWIEDSQWCWEGEGEGPFRIAETMDGLVNDPRHRRLARAATRAWGSKGLGTFLIEQVLAVADPGPSGMLTFLTQELSAVTALRRERALIERTMRELTPATRDAFVERKLAEVAADCAWGRIGRKLGWEIRSVTPQDKRWGAFWFEMGRSANPPA